MSAALLAACTAARADFDFGPDWSAGHAQLQAQADVFDAWSAAGGAWTLSKQPRFVTEHILLSNPQAGEVMPPDDDLEGGRMARLHSSIGSNPLDPHMWGHYFYTGTSAGTFTLSPSAVSLTDRTIVMAIVYTGTVSPSPVLHYGSVEAAPFTESEEVNLGESVVVDNPYEGVDYTKRFRVFTWDVSSFDPPESFEIVFSLPSHVAFSNIVVSQVPEPAAGVLLTGLAVCAGVFVARRRRRRG